MIDATPPFAHNVLLSAREQLLSERLSWRNLALAYHRLAQRQPNLITFGIDWDV